MSEDEPTTEPENEKIDRISIIKEKIEALSSETNEEEKAKLSREIDEQLSSIKKDIDSEEEIEHDPEYNAYNFARSAAVLSLASSWPKIKSKMDSLITQIGNTSLEYEKIIALKGVIEKFQTDYVDEVIHSKKPNLKRDNEKFESQLFHKIITDIPQTYADFFDVFIGEVTFKPEGNRLPYTQKFRAFMLDLRDKKKKDDDAQKNHTPDFKNCDLDNGMNLSRDFTARGQLYQGYWQAEYMLTELRNHTEHWKKSDNKKFLRKQLGRTLEDPVSGIESPGNLFILISILFLISYHFIDIMQTWIDTDTLLKK